MSKGYAKKVREEKERVTHEVDDINDLIEDMEEDDEN